MIIEKYKDNENNRIQCCVRIIFNLICIYVCVFMMSISAFTSWEEQSHHMVAMMCCLSVEGGASDDAPVDCRRHSVT